MHAIELLLDDHENMAGLFDRVRAGEGVADLPLFEKIRATLEIHKHIEETLFYPKLIDEGDDELKTVVTAALEEHRQVKVYLNELAELTGNGEKFAPKLKMVIEDVEQHVDTEEEKMFPLVEDQFDEEALEQLGIEMEAERAKFETAYFGSVPIEV